MNNTYSLLYGKACRLAPLTYVILQIVKINRNATIQFKYVIKATSSRLNPELFILPFKHYIQQIIILQMYVYVGLYIYSYLISFRFHLPRPVFIEQTMSHIIYNLLSSDIISNGTSFIKTKNRTVSFDRRILT